MAAAVGESEAELCAVVAYVGPECGGASANLRTLAGLILPEPAIESHGAALRMNVRLCPPWSTDAIRVQIEAWDVVPADEASRARLASAHVVVFVADSSPGGMAANVAAMEQLEAVLRARRVRLADVPHVLQYNHRDLRCVLPVRELREVLNLHGVDEVEAATERGRGALTTLVQALHAISPRRSRVPSPPG